MLQLRTKISRRVFRISFLICSKFMYRSNRSFNVPPGQPPGHLTFSEIIVQIPRYPGQNAVQMPHTRVHSGDQMPPPRGHFTGTKMTEGRRKRLQLSNKIFINTANNSDSIIQKLRNNVSVFTTNKRLVQSGGNHRYKVTECSAFLRVSCNI